MEKKPLPSKFSLARRVLLLVLAIFALMYVFGVLPKLDSGSAAPLLRSFLSAGNRTRDFFGDIQGFFASKKMLLRQLSELGTSNQKLEARNLFLESKIRNLERVERYLNGRETPAILAGIANQSLNVPYDTFLVDRGVEDGVTPGFKVVAGQAILLGEIERADRRTSRVKLLSYPGMKTEGYLESISLNVVIEGIGGANLKFSVPKTLEVKIGDRILSTSRPGYLIGQVELIKEKEPEPLKDIILRIPLNIRHLRFVELIP